MAAKNAAKNNFKTLLVDEKNELGGLLFIKIENLIKLKIKVLQIGLKKKLRIKKYKNLEIKTRTSVAAYHGYNYLLARENLN